MELKQLIADDDAVSPVIGVILMVAITVILAAVIGTFVLGIGQDQQSTPQAQFDFEFDSSTTNVTVSHQGGDKLTDQNTGQPGACSGASANGLDLDSSADDICWNTDISAGGSKEIDVSGTGDTVEVIWESPGGGDSQILSDFTVP